MVGLCTFVLYQGVHASVVGNYNDVYGEGSNVTGCL
jgi:hypothetical protein